MGWWHWTHQFKNPSYGLMRRATKCRAPSLYVLILFGLERGWISPWQHVNHGSSLGSKSTGSPWNSVFWFHSFGTESVGSSWYFGILWCCILFITIITSSMVGSTSKVCIAVEMCWRSWADVYILFLVVIVPWWPIWFQSLWSSRFSKYHIVPVIWKNVCPFMSFLDRVSCS